MSLPPDFIPCGGWQSCSKLFYALSPEKSWKSCFPALCPHSTSANPSPQVLALSILWGEWDPLFFLSKLPKSGSPLLQWYLCSGGCSVPCHTWAVEPWAAVPQVKHLSQQHHSSRDSCGSLLAATSGVSGAGIPSPAGALSEQARMERASGRCEGCQE